MDPFDFFKLGHGYSVDSFGMAEPVVVDFTALLAQQLIIELMIENSELWHTNELLMQIIMEG